MFATWASGRSKSASRIRARSTRRPFVPGSTALASPSRSAARSAPTGTTAPTTRPCAPVALAYTKALIDIAADLGGSLVVGPMYAGVGATTMRDDAGRRRQWDHAAGGLRQAADHAASRGIRLAMEPINRFETDLVNTVDQGVRMVADIARDNVGLLIDTFHMNIEEKSLPDAIRRAGKHIFQFHACGSDRGTPGEDHLPWTGIAAALRETGFSGSVVIEAFNPKITSIARAVSLWRPLAESEDALASGGLAHLRTVFG